jgi:hypothetical protein
MGPNKTSANNQAVSLLLLSANEGGHHADDNKCCRCRCNQTALFPDAPQLNMGMMLSANNLMELRTVSVGIPAWLNSSATCVIGRWL